MKWVAEFFRNLAGLAEACTVYTAAGATAGGAAAIIALCCRAEANAAAAVGAAAFFLPTAPLYWWFTSERSMEATFRRLDRWKQSGYITAGQHRELKEAALRWYRRRLFGRSGEPPARAENGASAPPASGPSPPTAPQ